jgi:hypothetical protein
MSHLQLLTILESQFTDKSMSDVIHSDDKITFVSQHRSEINSAQGVSGVRA